MVHFLNKRNEEREKHVLVFWWVVTEIAPWFSEFFFLWVFCKKTCLCLIVCLTDVFWSLFQVVTRYVSHSLFFSNNYSDYLMTINTIFHICTRVIPCIPWIICSKFLNQFLSDVGKITHIYKRTTFYLFL